MGRFMRLGMIFFIMIIGIVSIQARGDEAEEKAIADFLDGWKSKVAKERQKAAKLLPLNSVEALEHYETVLKDNSWTVRVPVINKLIKLESEEVKAEFQEAFEKQKDAAVKDQMLWAWGRMEKMKVEDWEFVHKVAQDDREDNSCRAVALRLMNRKLSQKQMKGNFEALFGMLKFFMSEKMEKKANRDEELRLLKWLTIYGLEKITSEEWGDSIIAWESWWRDNKESPLKYREDVTTEGEYGGVKVEGRTAVRKKPKKLTSTELLVLPQFGFGTDYFDPYLYEFTQYFKMTSFFLPLAEKIGKPVKDAMGNTDPNAYYYPMKGVAEIFAQRRKEQGGTVGMIGVEMSNFVAMEYAANDPEGCVFIICIGSWASMKEQVEALQDMRKSKREEDKQYARILRTYPRPDHTPEEMFDAQTGAVSHLFSNKQNPDHYYVSAVGQKPMKGSGRSIVLDPGYAFESKSINVPALFIWGEDDPMYVKGTEKQLKKYFKNARFVTMENVSRLPWLEDPITFYDTVTDFFDDFDVWDRIEEEKEKQAEKE